MKTITNLSGEVIEADFREPRGILTNVHAEPVPGVHLQIALGGAGLVVRRGDHAVALPLDGIIAAAAAHCPELLLVTPA